MRNGKPIPSLHLLCYKYLRFIRRDYHNRSDWSNQSKVTSVPSSNDSTILPFCDPSTKLKYNLVQFEEINPIYFLLDFIYVINPPLKSWTKIFLH